LLYDPKPFTIAAMPETPPTAPRLELAQILRDLRLASGLGVNVIAARLRCSPDTIRRIERGGTTVTFPMFLVMLDLYGVTDEDQRNVLEELWGQSDQPRWWSKYRLPESTGRMIGFEIAARTIKAYQPIVVHGLLQTEDYARALFLGSEPGAPGQLLERWIELRMERQQRMLESESRPELVMLFDEAVLRRPIGGPEVQYEQLKYLLDCPLRPVLQIVPMAVGGHPGCAGSFEIFEFEPKVRRAALYVEGQGGNLYRDEAEAVTSAKVKFDRIRELALSVPASRAFISSVMEDFEQ
jgi:transcriptional regulator with XRE-family HTH domain